MGDFVFFSAWGPPWKEAKCSPVEFRRGAGWCLFTIPEGAPIPEVHLEPSCVTIGWDFMPEPE